MKNARLMITSAYAITGIIIVILSIIYRIKYNLPINFYIIRMIAIVSIVCVSVLVYNFLSTKNQTKQ
jgi:uncharacterized membrane protein